jgi:hypothetical protein
MIFVLDTNSLSVLKNFYPATFKKLWPDLETLVEAGELVSVEEVFKEVQRLTDSDHLLKWVDEHKHIFSSPTEPEMDFVAEIFSVKHFQQLVSQDALLRGGLVADPWVIARAHALDGCVVTEERIKPQAAKIPNVCAHFGIKCTNLEGLLEDRGWRY